MTAKCKGDRAAPVDIANPSDNIEEIQSLGLTGPHKVFTDLLQRISALHGVPAEQVLAGDRNYVTVNVRRVVLKMCKSQTGISTAQLARWMGMKESTARYLVNSSQ